MSRVPLAVSRRNGRVEAEHFGSIAVADASGHILFGNGDVALGTYVRSSNKMIQALPVVQSGAADRFEFSPRELAVCCASHSGASYHVEAVTSMLAKTGIDYHALGCGVHEPADRAEFNRLTCARTPPTALHNNCSGKHAGMLAVCVAMGWDIEDYLRIEHPLQQWILELMSEHTSVPSSQIGIAIDGCSLPTFFLPISSFAIALARYVENSRDDESSSSRILSAVAAHPEMIYEHGGFDTELIRALGGRCIAKRGAMAMFVVGIDTQQYGAIGISVKLEDGNIAQMPIVVMRVLEQLGVLSAEESKQLARFGQVEIRNYNGILVGDVVADFMLETHIKATV